MLLDSAVEHYRAQQRITAAAVLAVEREKRGPLAIAKIIAAFQFLAARESADAVPLMLEEQSINAPAAGVVAPNSVAGVASDGRPLDTLVDYGQQFGSGWMQMVAATQIQDAARLASGLAIASRPRVHGWVRMMNPPSCSRCAVLAGKFFKWNQGFQRHPRCDCRHIPSQEADYSDVRLSGDKWFHTLDKAEQDRIFTKAGAEAARDGADLGQVVNARRGMETVGESQTTKRIINGEEFTVNVTVRRAAPRQIGSGSALITREGVTARGIAGRSFGDLKKMPGSRYRTSQRPRIMPETIYATAPSREEAIRLLKLNGFIF